VTRWAREAQDVDARVEQVLDLSGTETWSSCSIEGGAGSGPAKPSPLHAPSEVEEETMKQPSIKHRLSRDARARRTRFGGPGRRACASQPEGPHAGFLLEEHKPGYLGVRCWADSR
jgi:hypothetical protein